MRVTIKDVARQAGISQTTVSLYLNNHHLATRIADSTKKKIDEAIAVTGYAPSATARALRMGRSKTLGLIVGEVANEYFSNFIELAMKEAKKYGYQLMVSITKWDAHELKDSVDNLITHQIDGILDYSLSEMETSVHRKLKNNKYPLLLLDYQLDYQSELYFPVVFNDIAESINRAVSHLQSLGHEEIYGVLSTSKIWEDHFVTACENNKIKFKLLSSPLATSEKRIAAVRQVCNDRPNAIILNGRRTTGLLLEEITNNCPDYHPDIIMSYDYFCHFLSDPRIVGIIFCNSDQLAKEAVRKLIEMVECSNYASNERIAIPTDFILRSGFTKLCGSDSQKKWRCDY